jgi:hypothetical protein
MKTSKPRWFRAIRPLVVSALSIALLYVLSIGPVSAWVARTISSGSVSAASAATYDSRLHAFYRFYAPLSSFRMWLRFRFSGEAEAPFQYYEALFHRSRPLPDGRRVFTTWLPASALAPGESGIQFARRQCDSVSAPLSPRTEAFYLPSTQRLLVVLAPEDDHDLIPLVLDAALEDSSTWFADLKLP